MRRLISADLSVIDFERSLSCAAVATRSSMPAFIEAICSFALAMIASSRSAAPSMDDLIPTMPEAVFSICVSSASSSDLGYAAAAAFEACFHAGCGF